MAQTPRLVIGDWIWANPVTNNEFDIPIGGKIIAIESSRVKILDDDKNEVYISNQQILKTMHVSSINGVEDMINLGDLQEYAILRNLHKRYKEKNIYTYTGSMLIAINPYELLPIYTNALLKEYRNKKIEEMPPHIFAIGDNSYNDMKNTHKNQCIVISGESGAGKTESTKLILQYLASASAQHSWIEQQILETNPILEAFGNAKTIRNDNSSRFGKYIDVHFSKHGNIEGAKIDQYLLEKSRIVSQNKGERNYHIFYSMLEGLSKEEKRKLDLGEAGSYQYLSGGGTLTCQGRDERKEFSDITAAFKVLNFTDKEVQNIFSLLAAILHLGNLKFKSGSSSHSETSDVSDSNLAEKISKLLGLKRVDLCEALTKKTIYARGDKVVSNLSKQQATESRNAFVKGIYGQIFIMLVDKINSVICQKNMSGKRNIGVLDIFGFENFEVNSFEQFCINYANESLQQFFVKHIFKLEQEYYTNEGINWSKISFIDNQDVLDMIGIKSLNMFALIDDESKFPKGTDFTLLSKLHNHHGKKSFYLKPKSDMTPAFGIQHFAGEVFYDVPGFLEKNRDSFSQDLRNLLVNPQNEMLKAIFKDEQDTKTKKTLSSQFRSSLDLLMATLNACHPFFIRCIKPNEDKKPQVFDRRLCTRQLRYSGMMETAKIRQAGYPIRYTYKEFVDRFRYLGKAIPPSIKGNCKESTSKICEEVFKDVKNYQLGHTKLFLKHNDNEYLEELRNTVLDRYIVVLQKAMRGWIHRRRFLKLREAAIVMQKHFRARGYRSKYLIRSNGYKRIQARIVSRQLSSSYNKIRKNIVNVQARCRGYVARNKGPFGLIYSIVRQRAIDEVELKKKGVKNYRIEAESLMQKRLAEQNRDYMAKLKAEEEENERAQQILEKIFDFLPSGNSLEISEDRDSENFVKQLVNVKESIPTVKEDEEEDLSEYSFRKYAATYFAYHVNYQYSKKPLKDSLHYLPTPDDTIAAQALWITILRFMGDYPEPKFEADKIDYEPIMSKVHQTLSRSFGNRKEYKEILEQEKKMASMKKSDRKRLISMTMKKKNKLLEDVKQGWVEDGFASEVYNKWLNERRTNNLEKLHFVIGHGILREELRDEIFAMICKQLTNNYSKPSFARGWILLSLCVGCFSPTDRFINYLRAFIKGGPPGYAPFCGARLNRTFKNGARTQPPSYLELIATKNKDPINLEITLMDGTSQKVEIDSASTSEEIIAQIASTLGLTDIFGFSLFIALHDKVMSLGSESDQVMDAISQCEQYAKEQGMSERNCPWRLFLRKEIFTPWHDPAEDAVATNLIYHQVIRGLKAGELRCNAEADVASLIATQYYVENGAHFDQRILHTRIGEYLPSYLVKQTENISKWEAIIKSAFTNLVCVKQRMPAIKAKEFIVKYAQATWPILFSKFFEGMQLSGPELPKKTIIIAVNSTGMYMIDDQEQILLELTFADIQFVTHERAPGAIKFIFSTVDGDEYIFHTLDAKNMASLIQYILDGLKKRSRYCVAIRDYKHDTNTENFLVFKKGDLITLQKDLNGEQLMTTTWGNGECNGKTGDFPTEYVYIIPTLKKPPQDILDAFRKDNMTVTKKPDQPALDTQQRMKLHTLASYASEHFRAGRKVNVARTSVLHSARRSSLEELWKYANEPIYQPLLEKLLSDEEASKEACNIYTAILKYMGDLAAPKAKYSNEYTDQIFTQAMNNDMLRDEVYCQIMKQLTFNRLSMSEERGWELMYLITGLFLPSSTLLTEVQKFLKSRTHPFVEYCLQRLQKIQKVGSRKFPPYSIEVEAIQHRSMEIFHKIYFPDDSDEAVEVDSSTRAVDLCNSIAARLELQSTVGFSLFVAIWDKVFSVPEEAFFYDFLSELINWMRANKPSWGSAAPIQAQYQVFFMKKLWINTTPGRDPNADQIFHFHQEMPKYLKGYHKCGKEDAIKLGALILRARFEDNVAEVQANFQRMIEELVPIDVIRAAPPAEWKKQILAEYRKQQMSSEDAKSAFLKYISEWPTFGSTFFEVKQTTLNIYPELVIIAINRNGVNIIHPQTKDILVTFDYAELSNWSSGNAFFHLTVGNIMKKTKLLCETPQGYKMDDLITSYADYFRNLN